MKKIETKIAKNGKLTVKIDGKRAKLQDAIEAVFESDIDNNVIVIENHLGNIFTGGFSFENRYMSFVFNHTFSSNPDKVIGTYAFNMSEVAIEKIANHQFAEYKISEPIAEANPDDYAVSQEAMDVATNAEIEFADSKAQTSTPVIDIADYNTMMTWAEKVSNGQRDAVTPIKTYLSKFGYTADINEIFAYIEMDDLNGFRRYISQFPFLVKDDAGYIQKLYVQEDGQVVLAEIPTSEYPNTENNAPEFRYYIKSRRPIAGAVPKGYISATAGEMKAYSLCTDGSISRVPRKVVFGVVVYDHPLSDEQIINYDLHVDPRNPNPIIKGSDKEETQMTIEIPAEGKHEFTIGDDTVTFFNGKFHSVFSAKYHMAIVRNLVGCYSYCIFGDDDTKVHNVREHETSYDNFMETLYQRSNREKLLALCKDYIITDHLSENNSHMWYVNGKRSGQVKVYNLLQSYGLTIAEFLAEDEAYINERIAASAAKIAIEDQAKFLKDKIARDAQPCDDNDDVFNLVPDVDAFGDEQPTIRDKYWQANEIVAAEQKEIFGEFRDDYQMPDTALDPNADYFQIRIFPKFANGTESSFHATANDFNRALELINQFKTLDLPFVGTIKRNTVCGEEYYRHNRDGSETINPPQPKLPANIKDSLQRAMKAALEQYRRYNLNHNQKAANRERECFMICKKALKEVA